MSSQQPCFPSLRQASRLTGVGSSWGPSVATRCRMEPCSRSPWRSATLAGAVLDRAGFVVCLLDFRASAGILQFLEDTFRFLPIDALLDRLRGLVDQVLGFLQPKPGDLADHLDHANLGVAGGGEHDLELGLLGFRRRRGCTSCGGGPGARHRGGARAAATVLDWTA